VITRPRQRSEIDLYKTIDLIVLSLFLKGKAKTMNIKEAFNCGWVRKRPSL
jgi:hypothetical protein